MSRRKEPCRNYQRGSCQYGANCKFLHVTSQQARSNPFGFGSQSTSQFSPASQQQKPNPFGFGVQSGSQLNGSSNFGARNQSPAKPFENKWTRSSSTAAGNSSPFQKTDTQQTASTHNCTDPESCKRQIVEDFKNEAPLWKLTCYGHWKYRPCDIVGDVSYEELRIAAYEDAKRGLTQQSIVEKERNLLNSKLVEFDNLLRNPYVIQSSSSSGKNLFNGASNKAPAMSPQSTAPPSFSSFGQFGASTHGGFNTRTSATGTPANTVFGQPIPTQNSGQPSGGVNMKFGTSGAFGNQLPMQSSGSFTAPNTMQNGPMGIGHGQFSFPSVQPQFPSITNNQASSFSGGPKVDHVHQASVMDNQEVGSDNSIWLKKEWAIGEIPEDAPPERFC